jgi:putative MFS transporter
MAELPQRRQMLTLFWLSAYTHYTMSSWAILSPHLARDFGLDDAQVALLAGVFSLGTFGTFLLTRLADRHGRRRVLLASFGGLPVTALLTGLAPGETSFALLQIIAYAFQGALMAIVAVMIAEEIDEQARAAGQAWFGLFGMLGSALPLILITFLEDVAGGWRWVWAAAALPILGLAVVRRNIPETQRFERAEALGRAQSSGAWDLFKGRYRRRAVGLLIAGTFRPVAITATLTWQIYHMVQNLGFRGTETILVLALGGTLGMLGIPLGARLANRWGRRPTAVAAGSLTVLAGLAFYWVPADFPVHPAVGLAVAFFMTQIGVQAFGVADRCLDTELFPTHLRATYAGWTRIAVAVAQVGSHFAVSGLSLWLGGLVPAVTVLSLSTISIAMAVFLAVCPETKHLTLDAAALEEDAESAG